MAKNYGQPPLYTVREWVNVLIFELLQKMCLVYIPIYLSPFWRKGSETQHASGGPSARDVYTAQGIQTQKQTNTHMTGIGNAINTQASPRALLLSFSFPVPLRVYVNIRKKKKGKKEKKFSHSLQTCHFQHGVNNCDYNSSVISKYPYLLSIHDGFTNLNVRIQVSDLTRNRHVDHGRGIRDGFNMPSSDVDLPSLLLQSLLPCLTSLPIHK